MCLQLIACVLQFQIDNLETFIIVNILFCFRIKKRENAQNVHCMKGLMKKIKKKKRAQWLN